MSYDNYGYQGGCPPWVLKKRASEDGYSKGLEVSEKLIREKVLTKEQIDDIKLKITSEIKKEIMENEKIKLEKDLTEELTKKLSIELWERAMIEVEKYRDTYTKEVSLLPNFKIVIDNGLKRQDGIRIEEALAKKFELMGYEVERCLFKYERGHPDLICKKGLERIFVEVKSQHDGFGLHQAEWFLKNREKYGILYFVYNS